MEANDVNSIEPLGNGKFKMTESTRNGGPDATAAHTSAAKTLAIAEPEVNGEPDGGSQSARSKRLWLLLLLPVVPAGFAVNYSVGPSLATFLVNFFAIIPMSVLANLTLKRVVARIGKHLGAIIYVTFSNVVQIVSSILLLKSGQLDVLQSALIGGILCSLLLVLGMSFLLGGLNRMEQHYNTTMAQTLAVMMMLAATSLIVPTVSHQLSQTSDHNLVRQSRGASIVLLVVYAAYVVFAYGTHVELKQSPSQKTPKRLVRHRTGQSSMTMSTVQIQRRLGTWGPYGQKWEDVQMTLRQSIPKLPVANGWLLLFACSTAILGFNTSFAVDSISALTETTSVSKPFIGIVLLPILNNDLGPISSALKDDMDDCIVFTVGKCMQTALFVTPLMVIIAWGMGVELALYFDGFEVASLFTSVLLINYVLGDGKSIWIHGVLLIADWVLVAIAAWFAG